jgi:mxaJ protein
MAAVLSAASLALSAPWRLAPSGRTETRGALTDSTRLAFAEPTHLVVPAEARPDDDSVPADDSTLRVCADPNNLPFSNDQQQGFENRIADVIAGELQRQVAYVWQPQRRGFIRTTLAAGRCDVVMGVPARFDLVRTTQPYYRSTYVFVTRRDRGLHVSSFDDARLAGMRIGIQLTGDDYDNPPPAAALAERHLGSQVRGYPVYGDYSRAAPQRAIVDAVFAGDVDAAVVWGPLAGYFAARESAPLDVMPVAPATAPFVFEIAMGVRKDDEPLARALDRAIVRRRADIRRVLRQFGVPLLEDRS